jgi:hypothetical protein
VTLKSNLLHERRSALARGASIGLASPGRQVIHILVPGGSVGASVKHNEVSWDGPPGPPKSRAGRRPLSLPAVLVEMLSAHLAANALTAADAGSLVFTTPEGAPLDYANWRRRVWLPATKRAGLAGSGFHDIRRTNATQLIVATEGGDADALRTL